MPEPPFKGEYVQEIEEILAQTMNSGRISKDDRNRLSGLVARISGDRKSVSHFRQTAFDMARRKMDPSDHITLNWLESMVKVVMGQTALPAPTAPTVCFSPGESCREEIITRIRNTQEKMDICVFTITDNAIANPIMDAHRRGIKIRIITDEAKSEDLGSDIEKFHRRGIAVRMDRSAKHMHHKFAIFDDERVLTGSYNWTRAAAAENEENLVVIRDSRAVAAFVGEFEKLWPEMRPYQF